MTLETMRNGWTGIREWLRSSDADWFLDDAVYGALTTGAVADLLADFGLPETPENMRRVRLEMDQALTD